MVCIIIASLKEIVLLISEYKPMSFFFQTKSHKWVLCSNCWSDKRKWVWDLSDHLLCLNSTANCIQINSKFCEIIGAEVFIFLHSCALQWRPRSLTRVSKCRNYYLSSYQVEANQLISVWMHANIRFYWLARCQYSATGWFPVWFANSLSACTIV